MSEDSLSACVGLCRQIISRCPETSLLWHLIWYFENMIIYNILNSHTRIRLVGLVCSGLGVRNLGCRGFPTDSVEPMHNLGLSESIMLAGQHVIWIKAREENSCRWENDSSSGEVFYFSEFDVQQA